MKVLCLLTVVVAVTAAYSVDVPAQDDATPVAIVPGKCPTTGHALVSHETDCNAYYECSNGKRSFPYHCLENTVFNPYIEACDLEYNVDCDAIVHGTA